MNLQHREYVVKKNYAGKYLAAIILTIAAAVVAAVAVVLFVLPLGFSFFAIALLLFVVILAWLYKYSYIEYEYSITDGEFSAAAIYNRRSRRPKCEFSVKSALLIAPVTDTYKSKLQSLGVKSKLDLRSYGGAPESYMLVYKAGGANRLVYINGNRELVSLFRRYNPETVLSDRLPE